MEADAELQPSLCPAERLKMMDLRPQESTADGCQMQKKLQQAAHITWPHARW